MRFVLSKTHPLRRFWRLFILQAYRFERKVVPTRVKRIYWVAVSSAPSVIAYIIVYTSLPLLGLHYMTAAILATLVGWAVYFPVVRHRAFDGSGEVRKEGLALLLMYLVATVVQLSLLSFLIEVWNLHYVVALVTAATTVSSVRFPATFVIFLSRRHKK